ncbi:MAG: TonB family protein [Candidatus Latescibacterota bacterium]|jgi:TonB family protein
MNIVHARFGNTLSYSLYMSRAKRQQLARLRQDNPTEYHVKTRHKNPEADLHSQYWPRFKRYSLFTFLALVATYVLYPEYYPTVSLIPKQRPMFAVSDIPETSQQKRAPSPPRPKVPLAVEGEEVPDDVTIESTELDFDNIDLPDLAMAGPIGHISDEPMDYMEIDYKPHPVRIVTPEYPNEARKKHITGRVIVKVLVDKDGNVEETEVVSGPEVFRDAALKAAQQFRFRPGKHAGERRKVWMIMPIDFDLKN